jgi:hypothetical protein
MSLSTVEQVGLTAVDTEATSNLLLGVGAAGLGMPTPAWPRKENRMTKRRTKPVAPNPEKSGEKTNAGAAGRPAGGHLVEKPVASKAKQTVAGEATSEGVVVKRATKKVIRQALDELGINVPYYTARVVGGRLELRLYGGSVVYWPEAASEED